MNEKSIQYNNAHIVYYVIGNGPPLLLLHGFGEDHRIWENCIDVLQHDFKLILPDLPGSGKSDLITGENVGLEIYAEAVRQVLITEQIEKTTLIGHSMGGYISLAFAEKYPAMLNRLALFHSSAYADNEDKIAARKKSIEFIRKNGTEAFLKTSIPGLFFNQQNNNKVDAPADDLIEKMKYLKPEALVQYYQAMIARPDRTAILQQTNLPVLFVLGEHDQAVPFKKGLEQTHLPAHSHIHILRNSGHMGMLEEPAKSVAILRNFSLNG